MNQQSDMEKYDIDLFELIKLIWGGRKGIIVFMTSFLVLAILYLQFTNYKYSSSLKVMPVNVENSGVGSKLGGLASLAGVQINGATMVDSFRLYTEGLHSVELANILAKDETLLKKVFRKKWNTKENKWTVPSGILYEVKLFTKKVLGFPDRKWQAPNGLSLREYLDKEVMVSESQDGLMVTLSISTQYPEFGARLLWAIHSQTDIFVKKSRLERAEKHIAYLVGKLKTMKVDEYRAALIDLLAIQERMKMMAEADLPFAAETFGKAERSFKPTSPNPIIVLLIGPILGMVFGIVWLLFKKRINGQYPFRSNDQ